MGNEVVVERVQHSTPPSEVISSDKHTLPASSLGPVSPEPSTPPDQAPHTRTPPAVPSLTPTPPPSSYPPPHLTDSLAADGAKTRSAVARPVAQSPTASHQTSSYPLDEVKTATVDTSHLRLTPSPNPVETPPLHDQPFAKQQSAIATSETSMQSGSELQSPRSSSPPTTSTPPTRRGAGAGVTPHSKHAPRPSSASSTNSREGRKTAAKSSTPHGSRAKGIFFML